MHEQWVVVLTLMFAAVFVAALPPLSAWGQATGAVNGTVRDSAGAAVTEAAVVFTTATQTWIARTSPTR
jgi:hypothetical protein